MALVKNASAIALSAAAAAMLTLSGCGSSGGDTPAVDTSVNAPTADYGNINVHLDDTASCTGVDENSIWKGTPGSYTAIENPSSSAKVKPWPADMGYDVATTPAVAINTQTAGACAPMHLTNDTLWTINGTVDIYCDLTVDPGTIIVGQSPASYLAINPGAKLIADGNLTHPIVFTSMEDYNGTSTQNAQGEWGGLILLGNAYTDHGVQTYEAGSETFGSSDHTNDTESSGILNYVAVKHTGFAVAKDKELNGLSLGAVGSGTTITNVAVIGSADDATEFWGGTVNINGYYLYNGSDDSLDTDLGYSGTVTNLLVQQVHLDKYTYDSAVMETGNDAVNPGESVDDITRTHVVNATFYSVGGGISMKYDAGMTWDNVKVIMDNTNDVNQTMVKFRGENSYNTNRLYATGTGLCLKNQQNATALFADTNSKDDSTTKTAYTFWEVDQMVQN